MEKPELNPSGLALEARPLGLSLSFVAFLYLHLPISTSRMDSSHSYLNMPHLTILNSTLPGLPWWRSG